LTVYNYQPTATAGSDNVTPTSSAANNNDNGGGRGISCSTKQQQQQRTACYRCLYPKSTNADACKSCSDNGVLGMVPGVIGLLQAVEVIKILTGIGHVLHDRLVMYDSLHGTFMNIKKPPPRYNCAVCSVDATITTMAESEQSLLSVRGPSSSSTTTTVIPSSTCLLGDSGGGGTVTMQSISCIEYNNNVRNIGQPHILLDVRVPRQYEMCSLDGSINMPLEELESQLDTMIGGLSHGQLPIYCLCRRGIASATATRIIQKSINDGNAAIHSVYNITGGLQSWVETVDSDFPEY
jgi:adenylyltransferase/sulfurtransferase